MKRFKRTMLSLTRETNHILNLFIQLRKLVRLYYKSISIKYHLGGNEK